MTRLSKHDKTIAGLKACGFVQDFSGNRNRTRSVKYTVWHRSPASSRAMLVGQSGCLRLLLDGWTVDQSVSLTDIGTHKTLMAIGERAMKGEFPTVKDALDAFDRIWNIELLLGNGDNP